MWSWDWSGSGSCLGLGLGVIVVVAVVGVVVGAGAVHLVADGVAFVASFIHICRPLYVGVCGCVHARLCFESRRIRVFVDSGALSSQK